MPMTQKALQAAAAVLAGWALQQTAGVRLVGKAQEPSGTKVIAGVPVYNYHLAFETERATSFLQETKGETVAGREHWLLTLKEGVTDEAMDTLCAAFPKQCSFHGHSAGVPFLDVQATETELEALLEGAQGQVAFAEPDMPMYAIPEVASDAGAGTVSAANANSWGLGRIGVSGTPNPSRNGAGVHVFVLDTGIRFSHSDFGGRALPGFDVGLFSRRECNGDRTCSFDRQGHGTHCAGTVAGTRFGVAPAATVWSVKVLSDSGAGSLSWTVAGLDWVAASSRRPAIASLSLGGSGAAESQRVAVDNAVNRGVTVVVASGNSNADACTFSPAFVPSAITVGATSIRDEVASWSNFGTCVNILAPGVDIPSAGHQTDAQVATFSGTSMACPHVAGAAALLLQANPNLSPAQVLQSLRSSAFANIITGPLRNAPNLLLNTR